MECWNECVLCFWSTKFGLKDGNCWFTVRLLILNNFRNGFWLEVNDKMECWKERDLCFWRTKFGLKDIWELLIHNARAKGFEKKEINLLELQRVVFCWVVCNFFSLRVRIKKIGGVCDDLCGGHCSWLKMIRWGMGIEKLSQLWEKELERQRLVFHHPLSP